MPLEVGKLVARLELEADDYTKGIRNAKTEIVALGRQAETAGRDVGTGLAKGAKGADDLAASTKSAMGKVSSESASTFGKLEADAQGAFRQAESHAHAAGKGITEALSQAGRGGAHGLTDGLAGAAGDAESAGDGLGGSVVAGFAPRIASLGAAGGPVGIAIAGIAALGTAAVGAGKVLADQVMQGFRLQHERGEVQASFGWTPQQLATAGRAAGEAYAGTFGESTNELMRSAGTAMQSGLLGGDASAQEIQGVIEKLDTVTKIMGTDVPETARAAGQMVRTGLADNATEALDLMTAAQQRGANVSGDLTDSLVEYGTQFRKLGLDGADAMGLMKQAVDAGARDTDVAADGLKEFAIRAVDGSKKTTDAFAAMGVNADDMAARIATGGPTARAALDEVLDSIAKIPDETKRGQVAADLFGSQWEDLGKAFDTFDLSKARNELGDTADATQKAADTMGNDTASKIESAKRRIEVSADNMKMKLAEAFAPQAGELADWVTAHADEIQNFFILAARYGAMFGAAMLQAGGYVAGFVAKLMWVGSGIADGFLKPIGQALKVTGEMASHLPGALGRNGEAMKAAGEAAMRYGDGMRATSELLDKAAIGLGVTGDKAMELAQKIQTIPPSKEIKISDPGGSTVLERLQAMGVAVRVDNDKNIEVTAPLAPEVLAALRDIGVEVETRNGKQVLVTADDKVYRDKKAAGKWTDRETKIIDIVTGAITNAKPGDQTGGRAGLENQGVVPKFGRAFGGPISGPGGPRDDKILMYGSNGEFVHQASAVDYYGLETMNALNNRAIPRDAIPRYANGGLVQLGNISGEGITTAEQQSMWDAVRTAFPNAVLTSATRTVQTEGHADYHNAGKAIDLVGPMADIAAWIAQNFADSLELIHSPFGHNIKDGRDVGDGVGLYGAGTMAGHADHVHWALGHMAGAASGGTPSVAIVPLVQNPDGTWTSPSPAWAHLIKRESGGNPTIVQGITDVNSGGNEASGLFQIAKGTWAGYGGTAYAPTAGQATPQQQSIIAAKIFNAEGGSPWGSGLPGREDDAGLRSGLTMSTPPGGTPGDGYSITNPDGDSSSSTPPEDPTVATFTFKNPLEPWWWAGEKEYRQRIIDDHEKQQKWDEYWAGGDKAEKPKRGKKLPTLSEATQDLDDARSDLAIAQARQREVKPDADTSSKLSAQQSVTKAERKVREAQEVIDQIKNNPSGYLPAEFDPYDMPVRRQKPVRRAFGGPISGPGGPKSDIIPMWASNGEYVQQAAAVDYYGQPFMDALNARAIPRNALRRANGGAVGFGGYTDGTTDVMAPKNWGDWLGLATGAGFAAYNMLEPYVQMGMTGKVDLGSMTPTLKTGTTDTGMISGLVSESVGQISSQLNELIWAVKEGKNITVKIEGARAPSFDEPKLSAMRAGV